MKEGIDEVVLEEFEQLLEDEAVEGGIEKIKRIRRAKKVKDEGARYKNKKTNKGRERNREERNKAEQIRRRIKEKQDKEK